MRAIQDQYNVQISFRQKQKNFHTTTCVVKASFFLFCLVSVLLFRDAPRLAGYSGVLISGIRPDTGYHCLLSSRISSYPKGQMSGQICSYLEARYVFFNTEIKI